MDEKGTVSVGICVYNEERNIGSLIENLLHQPLSGRRLIEILVVASGCSDRTVPIVTEWSIKDDRVKLISHPKREGKIRALNELLKTFAGDTLVHMDADHIPCRGALDVLLKHLDDPKVGGVSSNQVPVDEPGFMGKINSVAWGLRSETQAYMNHAGKAQHLGGGLFAIRRRFCLPVPEDVINDDAFMGVQCKQQNYNIHFEPTALAFFNGAKNIRDFVVQRRRVLFGHFQVKKFTGVSPMVFETAPLSDKLQIFRRWVVKHWTLVGYLFCACLIEVWINLLATFDQLRGDSRHRVWTIAASTKGTIHSR